MIEKVRNWLRKFLGIDRNIQQITDLKSRWDAIEEFTKVGVDLHFNPSADTQIIVISHLNRGYVKVVDTRFDSFTELISFVKHLKQRYKTYDIVWDGPPGLREQLKKHFTYD